MSHRGFVSSLVILAVVFVNSIVPALAFSDVNSDDWYSTYAQELAVAGVIDGSKSTFDPLASITRDVAAKIIVKAAGYKDADLLVPTIPSFNDVPKSSWSYPYIETAKSLGFVSGYGNGIYAPGNEVTRAEFAAMIMRAFKFPKNSNIAHFTDVTSADWFYDVVETVYNLAIVNGYKDGSFQPSKPVNRAEMSKIVVRAMNLSVPKNIPKVVEIDTPKNTGLIVDGKVVEKPKVTNSGSGSSGTSGKPDTSVVPSTSVVPPIDVPTIKSFIDDFSSYTNAYYDDGDTFVSWFVQFAGYGLVGIESDANNKWLRLSPKAMTSAATTSASLVTGPSFKSPFQFEAKLLTVQQLRTGSTPNGWEVAWIVWNYTDNEHFYYFIPKPNGWELGKRDPAYTGGQRFLATGSDTLFPIGKWYDVKIEQDATNTMTVWVDGVKITSFTDLETPYSSGNIALYTEDALINVDDVSVKY